MNLNVLLWLAGWMPSSDESELDVAAAVAAGSSTAALGRASIQGAAGSGRTGSAGSRSDRCGSYARLGGKGSRAAWMRAESHRERPLRKPFNGPFNGALLSSSSGLWKVCCCALHPKIPSLMFLPNVSDHVLLVTQGLYFTFVERKPAVLDFDSEDEPGMCAYTRMLARTRARTTHAHMRVRARRVRARTRARTTHAHMRAPHTNARATHAHTHHTVGPL